VTRKPRVRQHNNPLSFREPVATPDWERVFADPGQPLEVDIGTGHGAFLLARAAQRPDLNLVGLELREPFVERVNRRIAREDLRNAVVVRCNANQSFTEFFRPGTVHRAYVHFPDPWFKKRHHKRRVMTEAFVDDLRVALADVGELRFQTDFADYAAEVEEMMAGRAGWVDLGVPPADDATYPKTHREEWHESQGDPVHRHLWRKA